MARDPENNPNARKRHTIRLYRDFKVRLPAIAEAHGLSQSEYIEWCVMRDEEALRLRGAGTAAIGRQMLAEHRRENRRPA
jgi:hypothetical protein